MCSGQAILALAAQINELASLFKELNVLVIEQVCAVMPTQPFLL
jgi:hypothetical protein